MAEFLPLCDVLFNVISLAGYFCDVVFDLVMGYALLKRGQTTAFAVCFTVVAFSSVVSQVSLKTFGLDSVFNCCFVLKVGVITLVFEHERITSFIKRTTKSISSSCYVGSYYFTFNATRYFVEIC